MYSIVKRDDIMRDLTRLASRIVMFFMQFYYRLARHSRVSYKAYIDGRTRLTGYNTIQDNVLLAGAVSAGALIFAEGVISPMQKSVRFVRSVVMSASSTDSIRPVPSYLLTRLFSLPNGQPGFSSCPGKNGMRTAGISIGNDG